MHTAPMSLRVALQRKIVQCWRPATLTNIRHRTLYKNISNTKTIKPSLLHQQNYCTLSDGHQGLKDQINSNLGLTNKIGNFESMLPVNQHWNESIPNMRAAKM